MSDKQIVRCFNNCGWTGNIEDAPFDYDREEHYCPRCNSAICDIDYVGEYERIKGEVNNER
jgi:hypothetical protein